MLRLSKIFVFLLFVISGCSQNNEFELDFSESDPELIDKAVANLDLDLCERTSSDFVNICMDNVYLAMVLENENLDLCSEIIDNNLRIICSDIYHINKVDKTKDLSFCDYVNDDVLKAQCGRAE